MSILNAKNPTAKDYKDGRTKQAFLDETDINKILKRAQKTGTISHLNKHQASYGDFTNFDFFANQIMLAKGREVFDDLPSELRNEFANSPGDFFKYVNDPENKDRLGELLPGLAAPGRQNIAPNNNAGADAPEEPTEAPTATTPAGTPAEPTAAAPAATVPPT